MDYIYIDESGELAKQSDYFVFGAIMTNNPKEIDNIIKKTRKKYIKQLGNSSEIKGYTTDDYIIKKILNLTILIVKLQALFQIRKISTKYIIVYDYNILYDGVASELAQIINMNNSTFIIVDKCKNKQEEINNFNKQFISNLNNSKNHSVGY